MYCNTITLEDISNVISILTPVILLIRFYYSQRSTLSKDYFNGLTGIYAGFHDAVYKPKDGETVYGE
jgi:hypothetical protein